ncbi:hypothetical protein [Stutzerimonas nitrititolerans]|uniref:hypothetical protein n=1 Tax=Stutzerimonas nitrititolerans TaxID=2482751 RepID=UPI001BD2BA6A|nr:hypothetical protein [Stutzerimonas nitrititolerans]
MKTFYVLTRHNADGSRSVAEIYYYDENGEMQIDRKATEACDGLAVRDDCSVDAWIQIEKGIADRLSRTGILFDEIQFD